MEDKGRHLLKKHHYDPHWSRKRGAVMAWEQVSMYGLVIVEKRRVRYETIDPVESRRIFIMEALVRGEDLLLGQGRPPSPGPRRGSGAAG